MTSQGHIPKINISQTNELFVSQKTLENHLPMIFAFKIPKQKLTNVNTSKYNRFMYFYKDFYTFS